jgi:hypothetical protein
MSRFSYRPLTFTLLLALSACATAGSRNLFQLDVGRGTRPDILEKVPRILDQQGYEVQERRDTGNVIQYMSTWVTRVPFADEAGRGAEEARTRVTFEARQQGGGFYVLTLKSESTMLRTFDGQWVNLAPSPMFREHMREVSDALALEIDMGVRTR